MPRPRVYWLTLSLIILLSLLGADLIVYATYWGPWGQSDSVEYIEVAHNIQSGLGPVQIKGSGNISLITQHPPFYSYLLSGIGLSGMNLVSAARWLDVALFAAFLLFLGLSFYSLTSQPLLALAVCLYFVTSPVIILDFSSLLSEPLFFALAIPGIILLVFYLQKKNRWFLILSALLNGLALTTRFTGITFIATVVLVMLFYQKNDLKRWIVDAALFSALSAGPFLIWIIYLRSMGGSFVTFSNPFVNWLQTLYRFVGSFIDVIWNWLPNGSASAVMMTKYKILILLLAILILAALIGVGIRRKSRLKLHGDYLKPSVQLGIAFIVFGLVYFAFIFLTTYIIRYPKPRIDDRILSPILISIFIGFIIFFSYLLEDRGPNRPSQWLPFLSVLVLVSFNIMPMLKNVQLLHDQGVGYTSAQWQGSSVIPVVRQLPPNIPVVSSNIDAIMFFTFRPARRLPELENNAQVKVYQKFGNDLSNAAEAVFREKGAALVIFNSDYHLFNDLYGKNTSARLEAMTKGLYKYYEGPDGAIFFYQKPIQPWP
jgi:hypothetical protein